MTIAVRSVDDIVSNPDKVQLRGLFVKLQPQALSFPLKVKS